MKWHILHTKPRNEKKVEKQLIALGINAYCPTKTEFKFWSDRKKKVSVPVLPSMVLVKISEKEKDKVFYSPAVIKYMHWLGKKAVVRQEEVDVLKKYLKVNYDILNTNISKLELGDELNLALPNKEKGIVKKLSKSFIWIYLKSLGYTIKLNLA
ncbi:UpxY family transcription antiterminator [Flavobacteriales bacterium]|nr:UpxY family transcription antiterminator [Flavobacteriales bacterium]